MMVSESSALGRFGAEQSFGAAMASARDLPRLLAAVRAVEALHVEGVWECPNPRHTNLDVACPDCLTVCVECRADYPCPTVRALTEALVGEMSGRKCPVCRMNGAHKLDCPKRETMDKEDG